MNFFTKAILGSVAVLLLAAAVVILFRSREGARVEALIREAVGWAERGEADRVALLLDDDFYGEGFTLEAARAEIRRRIRPGAFEKLEVMDLKVGVDGDDAHVRIVLRVQSRDVPMAYPETLHLTLRKRDEGWRVLSARRPEGRSGR